eukprot:304056-Prymnesium_polylepis.1
MSNRLAVPTRPLSSGRPTRPWMRTRWDSRLCMPSAAERRRTSAGSSVEPESIGGGGVTAATTVAPPPSAAVMSTGSGGGVAAPSRWLSSSMSSLPPRSVRSTRTAGP